MNAGLKGKVALITGAAQGIGSASAVAIAKAGAHVILCDVNDMSDTECEIKECGGNVRTKFADVSQASEVGELFKSIEETEQKLDFTINAAGILSEGKIDQMEVFDFDKIISVNLRGSFLIARGAACLMKPAKSGRIILISSELAYLGREDFSAYCASKAGVVGLTRALARELAPDITINSVAPGPVDTPMLSLENMSKAWIDKELDIPLKRVGKPDEIAALIRFLCSSSAGFFTGQTISPNGGAVML